MIALAFLLALPASAAPKILPVPLIAQTTDYDCGPTALASVLKYWGVFDGKGTDLFGALETTPKDGTDPVHLVRGAAKFGLKAGLATNMTVQDLRDALERGDTVILDVQAWRDEKTKKLAWKDDWDDGHYVVLAGLDTRKAYVMDPSTHGTYAWLPIRELEERWHDFEDRHGAREEYRRLGIVISGTKPLSAAPVSGLARME
jgi:predicted double-glycine peptidase